MVYKRKSKSLKKKSHSRKRKSSKKTQHLGCTWRKSVGSCGGDPNCNWTKRGCVRRSHVLKGTKYQGPQLPAGFHYPPQVQHKGCTWRKTAGECGSDPNCDWTKKGCVRRSKVLAGTRYEGPMLQ